MLPKEYPFKLVVTVLVKALEALLIEKVTEFVAVKVGAFIVFEPAE